ncbi:MAG: fatty acid--CoA ligase family protein [Pseudomonadota bacterium]
MSNHLALLADGLARFASRPAVVAGAAVTTYADLADRRSRWIQEFTARGVAAGEPVGLATGFQADAIAALLALFELRAVAVMLAPDAPHLEARCRDARARRLYRFEAGTGEDDGVNEQLIEQRQPHDKEVAADALLDELRSRRHGGFVVFSSGSSGDPKAVLHDAEAFCTHLAGVAKAKSTIALLALDHIAGIDTLLYTLFAGGCLVVPSARSPEAVCRAIAASRAQVLPASPSFLRLLLLSRAHEAHDLSSLEIITFGSEPPDPATSATLAQCLPGVTLLQKYGTSEFGAPRSRTRADDPSWIRIDSPNCEVKVVDDVLWVRASGTMLGYLNRSGAGHPAADEGWYCTDDRVQQDGPWLRVLGRESDLINVGGEKVFPAEVERCIESLPEVIECAVSGEPNDLMGNVVVARVRLNPDSDCANPKALVRKHARAHLPRHAVPVRVIVTDESLTSVRGKRLR